MLLPSYNANTEETIDLQRNLKKIGILVDVQTGHLFYGPEFKPLNPNFKLAFVRHGETYGNCGQSTAAGTIDHELVKQGIKNREKRVYQGNVDAEINQLTLHGKKQADELALTLEKQLLAKNWEPDVIFYSPLNRAKETGLPFVERNRFHTRYLPHEGIKEMQFGAWENRRICDIELENPCHLFYLTQHALVKNSGINANGLYQTGECFCEVLLRAHQVLCEFKQTHGDKKILIFSHSMFGAACRILFGQGQKIENDEYLAFDGKRKDGTYYAIPFTTPILFA